MSTNQVNTAVLPQNGSPAVQSSNSATGQVANSALNGKQTQATQAQPKAVTLEQSVERIVQKFDLHVYELAKLMNSALKNTLDPKYHPLVQALIIPLIEDNDQALNTFIAHNNSVATQHGIRPSIDQLKTIINNLKIIEAAIVKKAPKLNREFFNKKRDVLINLLDLKKNELYKANLEKFESMSEESNEKNKLDNPLESSSVEAANIINNSQPQQVSEPNNNDKVESKLIDEEQQIEKVKRRIDKLSSNFVRTVSFVKKQLGHLESEKIIPHENFIVMDKLVSQLLSEDQTKLQEYLDNADVASLQCMINNLSYIHAVLTELNREKPGVFTTLAKNIRALLHLFTFKKFFAPEEVEPSFDLTQLEEKVKHVVDAHYKKSIQADAWKQATENYVHNLVTTPVSYAAKKAYAVVNFGLGVGETVANKVAKGSGQVARVAGKVAGQVQHGYFHEKAAMGRALRATGRMLNNDVYATSMPFRHGYQTAMALPGAVFGKKVETNKLSETEKVGRENAEAIVETANKPAVKYPILLGTALGVGFLAAGFFNSN